MDVIWVILVYSVGRVAPSSGFDSREELKEWFGHQQEGESSTSTTTNLMTIIIG